MKMVERTALHPFHDDYGDDPLFCTDCDLEFCRLFNLVMPKRRSDEILVKRL